MEELGHYGSDDDDGGLAFLLEAFGEGFADGVEAHGRHGRKEQRFADVAVARLAHRGARFATRAALEDAWCDSRVGGKLTGILEQRQIRQLGDEVGGALFPDPFDADDELQGAGTGSILFHGGEQLVFELGDLFLDPLDVRLEGFHHGFVGAEIEAVRLAGAILLEVG